MVPGKRVSGTRAIEACLQYKHPKTGPACRSREDLLSSGSSTEVDGPIALLPSWEKENGERHLTCSGVSDLRGVNRQVKFVIGARSQSGRDVVRFNLGS